MDTPRRLDHEKEIVKLLHQSAHRRDRYQVFSDCVAAIALTISNAVDLVQREDREQQYLKIVAGYERDELDAFPKVLAHLAMSLEEEPSDVLGRTFHAMELHNKARGQFFTPYDVCKAIAQMQTQDAPDLLKDHGFLTVLEPAVGTGAMVIALAQTLRDRGINYQQHLHVTAVDVDERAAHMAYSQFSLLHIPAVVQVGDSLTGEVRESWFTPAHIIGGWSREAASRSVRSIHRDHWLQGRVLDSLFTV